MGVSLLLIGAFLFSMPYCKDKIVVEGCKGVESNNSLQTIKENKRFTQLQVYIGYIEFPSLAPLCSTIVVCATEPFNEYTINWYTRPPIGDSLAAYKSVAFPGWYNFSSSRLENYVNNIINAGEDTIPLVLDIFDRNGGICDIVWHFSTKESGQIPRLIHGSNTYLSIGDAWVSDGPPLGPGGNSGTDLDMLVCSCTLSANSGTQFSYVEFPTGVGSTEESDERSSFIFEIQPNPFSSFNHISYVVPYNEARVTLSIYNVMGEGVNTLVDKIQPAGKYNITWTGKDGQGKELSSGYYFYKLRIGNKTFTAKSLLLRL